MIKLINNTKYFLQFIIISLLLLLFKLLGIKISRFISGKVFTFFGPFFRSKIVTLANINQAFPNESQDFKKKIISEMWVTYGKILAEYNFIKNFREEKFKKKIEVDGQLELEKIKSSKHPVIFVSGHFDNFELMAMHIEKSGIDVAAIYRPLNNIFLNPIMEYLRKRYICRKQIKKGISGTKELLKNFNNGTSVALMIDQRVSEGINSNFFNQRASTTTIPAQFVKKFKCKVQPVHIERYDKINFKITFDEQIILGGNEDSASISLKLNQWLENKIKKNPSQWIWTHDRWK